MLCRGGLLASRRRASLSLPLVSGLWALDRRWRLGERKKAGSVGGLDDDGRRGVATVRRAEERRGKVRRWRLVDGEHCAEEEGGGCRRGEEGDVRDDEDGMVGDEKRGSGRYGATRLRHLLL